MRQLRQMLRLHHDGLGAREIGRRLGVARSTIQDNLKRVEAVGLAWPLAPDLSDEVLEQRLFSNAGSKRAVRRRTEVIALPGAAGGFGARRDRVSPSRAQRPTRLGWL
jgi:transposase